MDVILIAPHETPLRDKILFRENNIKNDFENIAENTVNFMFVKFLKDNLGIASLAAFLRKYEHTVRLINSYLNNISIEELCDIVIKENPVMIGISLLYDLHSYSTCQIAKLLRKKGYKGHITLGGPFITLTYEYFLRGLTEVDSVIRGEGEITILKLLEKLKLNESWHHIEGIAYRTEKNVIVNEKGLYENELSNLPLVSRDLYIELVDMLKDYKITTKVASIYTSRGCRGRCSYCSAPILGNLVADKWRCRTVESVVAEITYLVQSFGVEYINIIDENFYGYGEAGKNRLYDFANAIIASGLKVKFWAEIRVDIKYDEELFQLLKQAGLQDVLLGLESGSQTALNRWRKGTTVKQNKMAIEFIRKCGFVLEPSLIMVDPYTKLEEFKDTVKFIEETKLYSTAYPLNFFNQLIVFPGTEIEQQLVNEKIISKLNPSKVNEISDDCEEIFRFCQKVSSRNYEIIDPVMRTVWSVLVDYTNKLAFLLDDFIPAFIKFCRKSSSNTDSNQVSKAVYFDLITKIGKWRRNIGTLILNLLKESVDCAEEKFIAEKDLMISLNIRLHDVINSYSKHYMDQSLKDFIMRCETETNFDLYKDVDCSNFFG